MTTPTGSFERVALGLLFACLLLVAWASPAQAQIFSKGARTEFISGFGFRTFVSFLAADRRRGESSEGSDAEPRERRVRATPLVMVYGLRPALSVVAVLPFVDKTIGTGAGDLGGDGGLGDSVFLAKWRFTSAIADGGHFNFPSKAV